MVSGLSLLSWKEMCFVFCCRSNFEEIKTVRAEVILFLHGEFVFKSPRYLKPANKLNHYIHSPHPIKETSVIFILNQEIGIKIV